MANITKLTYTVQSGQTASPSHLNNVISKVNEIAEAVSGLPSESSSLAGIVIDPSSDLQSQFENAAIYYIRGLVTFTGTTSASPLTVPSGSVVVFENGSFGVGYVNLDGVSIIAPPVPIFKTTASASTRCNISGKPAATYPCAEWFGAKGNGTTSDNNAIYMALSVFGRCFLLNRSYAISVGLNLPENSSLIGTGVENTKLVYSASKTSTASLIHPRVGSSMRDLSIVISTPSASDIANIYAGIILDIYPDTDALRDVSHLKPRYIFQRLSIRFSDYPGSKANMKATGVRLADINRKGIYHALIEDVDVEFCSIAFAMYAANTGGTSSDGVSYVNTNRIDRCRAFDCATSLKLSSANSCEIRGNEIDITTQNLQEQDDMSMIYDIPTDFLCANNNIKGYLWDIKAGSYSGVWKGGIIGNIGSNNVAHTNQIMYCNGTDYYMFVGCLRMGGGAAEQFVRLGISMYNKAPEYIHLILDKSGTTVTPRIWQLIATDSNWFESVWYVKHGSDYYIFLKGIPAGYLRVDVHEYLSYYPPAFVANSTTLPGGDASGEFLLNGSLKVLIN